jgi:hypothetical protein
MVEFFNVENGNAFLKSFDNVDEAKQVNANAGMSDFFHADPINYANKKFESDNSVFVKETININLDTIIESYNKTIRKF